MNFAIQNLNTGRSIITMQPESVILLVDDRPENLLTLECVLESSTRKFHRAVSGNEALKIALQEPLTLIMMDIQMPDMDGFETARLLRMNPRTSHIPIIFVSAINPKEKVSLEAFESGTVDFLFKPLNLADTKSKVAMFEKLWFNQEEIKRLRMAYERLSRDFSQFVFIASHDLKTPLRAINNLADWISDDLKAIRHDDISENLQLMKERVAKMNTMIDGILDYSRAGNIQEAPETTDLAQLVQAVFERVEAGSGFTLELSGSWPNVVIQKIKLEKIFWHLLSNACTHHHAGTGHIVVCCRPSQGRLVFSVSDDGPGINPIHHKAVFEMFHVLHPALNTAGTGLAIVKKIVCDAGEDITIRPNSPSGTVFTFGWPCG